MPVHNLARTLIATLGTEAQVVTLTLDYLLSRNEQVNRVVVVHTAPPEGPVAAALERVRAEFASGCYSPSIQLHTIEITSPRGPLPDVDSAEGAEAAFVAIYRAVRAEKLDGRNVHLSIAGGRKTMSAFGMAAAQMLFDRDDRLWHLISHGRLLEEKRMHTEPGDTLAMVEIPVILWNAVSPVLTDLSEIDDPFAAVERQRSLKLREALDEARAFVLGSLSGAERRVIELLVREGLGNAEIAERLSLSARTVERHVGEAADKATAHWGLASVNRAQLVALLGLHYAMQP